jgi:hypothetical protein
VNEFVEECRREWRRLGVPDPVANEMAADLTTDLEEAAADGVSAAEVLGSGVFDPKTFAANWAAERGVIPPPAARRRRPSNSWFVAAVVASALVAIVGALLVLFTPPPHARVAVAPVPPMLALPHLRDVTPGEFGAPPPPVRLRIQRLAVNVNGPRDEVHTIGSVLVIVGVAGIVLLTLFSLWTPVRFARARGR